ncbi:MAG: hypothetical protein WCL04_04960 [Verrucomicrobiota bacterium]
MPSSSARTSSSVSGLPSMAVELWVFRARVSFCNFRIGGLHGSCRQGHGKLILGLPQSVPAGRVHAIIKDWLGARAVAVTA